MWFVLNNIDQFILNLLVREIIQDYNFAIVGQLKQIKINCCSALPAAHSRGRRGGACGGWEGGDTTRGEYRYSKKFRRRVNRRGAQGTLARKLIAVRGRARPLRGLCAFLPCFGDAGSSHRGTRRWATAPRARKSPRGSPGRAGTAEGGGWCGSVSHREQQRRRREVSAQRFPNGKMLPPPESGPHPLLPVAAWADPRPHFPPLPF